MSRVVLAVSALAVAVGVYYALLPRCVPHIPRCSPRVPAVRPLHHETDLL